VYGNQSYGRQPMGFGSGGRPYRDVLILIGVLFVTYSMARLGVTAMQYAYLSTDVFRAGHLWRLLTYAFAGFPTQGSIWFLITLLILYWFSQDVYRALGQKSFRWMLLSSVLAASIAATLTQLILTFLGAGAVVDFYPLMQGQYVMATIMIAAFAVLYGHATIYFMFVIPIRARWFLWIEILLAFMGYLDSRDFAGFVGLCAAVGMTYSVLTTGSLRRTLKEIRLRVERRYLELKMKRLRARRGMRIVKKDDDVHRGPWVN
jgi:hypothetical protein